MCMYNHTILVSVSNIHKMACFQNLPTPYHFKKSNHCKNKQINKKMFWHKWKLCLSFQITFMIYRIVYKYLKKLKITKEFNMQIQNYCPQLPHNLHYIHYVSADKNWLFWFIQNTNKAKQEKGFLFSEDAKTLPKKLWDLSLRKSRLTKWKYIWRFYISFMT